MESISAEEMRRLRAVILEQVYVNHQKQLSHLDLIRLGGSLERIGWEVSLNELLTTCQDLQERGFLSFDSVRNKWTGDRNLVRISITPKGRNIVEGAERDPGVLVIE
jgi:hypothetical protein